VPLLPALSHHDTPSNQWPPNQQNRHTPISAHAQECTTYIICSASPPSHFNLPRAAAHTQLINWSPCRSADQVDMVWRTTQQPILLKAASNVRLFPLPPNKSTSLIWPMQAVKHKATLPLHARSRAASAAAFCYSSDSTVQVCSGAEGLQNTINNVNWACKGSRAAIPRSLLQHPC
jgi:hypothetical protein